MDVILREDVEKLGHAGEVVTVKDGYARNFLLPRGLAYLATDGNRRRLDAEQRQRDRRAAAEVSGARDEAARLGAVSLSFTMKAGEGDKLFGSVTAGDIAEHLKAEGMLVDRRAIELDEPLKALGAYKVPIRLHADVKAEIRVWVVKE
jgi:large subunit ribosomal protein L9